MGKRNGNSQASVSRATPRFLNRVIVTTRFTCRLLLYLTQRHPILFWTSSWLLLVLISWISLKGILQIDVSPLQAEQPQSEVVVQAPPLQYSDQQPASSFGLMAAVVVCCGATSLLLARRLRPVKAAPRFQGKLASRSLIKRSAPPVPTALPPRPQAPSASLKTAPQSARRTAPKAPKSSAKTRPVAARSAAVAAPRQPRVTVVPQYEDHSLDWTEPGLAEMMDIRKRDSMSSSL